MEFNNNDNNERKPPNRDQLGLEVSQYWYCTGVVRIIFRQGWTVKNQIPF